jgi:hypothetical protein
LHHADGERVARLSLLASAISRRPLQVVPAEPGEPAWTDGTVVYVDPHTSQRAQVESLAVQASLLAAGSFDRDIVRALVRRPTLARRYLSVEGHRALAALDPLLPPAARSLIRSDVPATCDSPAASLAAAKSRRTIADPPDSFGTIDAQRLLASLRRAERVQAKAHAARTRREDVAVQLAPDADADADTTTKDPFSIPGSGGGPIGRWLAKLLMPVRRVPDGGSPGVDAATRWARTSGRGGRRGVLSTTIAEGIERRRGADAGDGVRYPEWDVHAGRYREAYCTVSEIEVRPKDAPAPFGVPERTGLRRSLARLGLGIDRYHRQAQGDDVDIDAAIEACVERMAGSAPDDDVLIDSVRRRRDLSVLVLLDVSGSAAEPAVDGKTVHEHQRVVAAALTLALHELGDRVALYAYRSQGRSAVHVMPVKRFGEDPGALVIRRLGSLEPGGYSRLGAAVRHGATLLRAHGGTPRRLLVVLSDGLAYDHGYEPVYGAADARRALGEARHEGVGCLCLSVGPDTNGETLRRVFGTSAHAALPTPDHLCHVIGPLFRAALRSADVRRRLR